MAKQYRRPYVVAAILVIFAQVQGQETRESCDRSISLESPLQAKLEAMTHCLPDKPVQDLKQHENYDVMIDVEDLETVMIRDARSDGGWPMEVASQAAWKKMLASNTVKVAVIGMYNRGKTFLVNAMAKRNLQASKFNNTRGISVVIDTDTNICYMDTAGENRALPLNGKTRQEADDLIWKRKNGVQFLQDVVIQIADVVVVVVNQMTLEDQRYIQAIARKLFQRKKDGHVKAATRMIVVHNYKTDLKPEQLETLLKQDIEGAGNAQRFQGYDEVPYWKSQTTDTVNINHMYLPRLKEGKPAQTYAGIQWLRDSLQQHITELYAHQMAHSFMDKFAAATKENLPSFFDGLQDTRLNGLFKLVFQGEGIFKHNFQVGPGAKFNLSTGAQVENWKVVKALEFDIAWTSHGDTKGVNMSVEIPGVVPESLNPDVNNTDYVRRDIFKWYGKRNAGTPQDEEPQTILEVNIHRETALPYLRIDTYRPVENQVYLVDHSGKNLDGKTYVEISLKPGVWYSSPTVVKVTNGGILELCLPIREKLTM